MIIDTSYFLTKSVFIPNAVAQPSIGSNTPTAVNQLQEEIDFREDELLLSALGQVQFLELKDQFETSGAWKVSALQKWKDLVDGVVYDEDSKKWNGLRYTTGTKKNSLIAFYVFFYYLKSDFQTYSTTGMQIPNAENSERQIPNFKQAEAWNSFVNFWNGKKSNLNPTICNVWNGTAMQWNSNNDNQITLYDFLRDNSDVYDTSFFRSYSIINPFNL